MSLDRVIDPLAGRLASALGHAEVGDVRVGDVAPVAPADLPSVVLGLENAQQALAGIGRLPRGTRTGALRLSATVDLAHPVLDLGDGDGLPLLSADRRTLTLPHGPIVRADGTAEPPFDAADISADDGAPFTVVGTVPAGRQVRADPAPGTLTFGEPLAPTGKLVAGYHIGAWDTMTTRVQALLTVRITAVTAGVVSEVARVLARTLDKLDLGVRLVPASWGPVLTVPIDDGDSRSQLLTFHLDAELEDPVFTTGGGVVARIAVAGRLSDPAWPGADPAAVEPFDVTRGVRT